MNMVRHRVNPNNCLILAVDDAGNIFVKFVFVLFWDKGLSSFDSENDMNVKLGIGISHDVFLKNCSHAAPLWGFRTFGLPVSYKHAAPLGLSEPIRPCFLTSLFSRSQRLGLPFILFPSIVFRHIVLPERKSLRYS